MSFGQTQRPTFAQPTRHVVFSLIFSLLTPFSPAIKDCATRLPFSANDSQRSTPKFLPLIMTLLKNQHPDPSTFIAYSHAAAGHEGVRSDPTGAILIKPCTAAEVAFYESAADHPDVQVYMPVFMGTLALNENQEKASAIIPAPMIPNGLKNGAAAAWVPSGGKKINTGLSIVLENVTAGFKRPNVIDLKLGARLWNDDAPEAKRRKLDETSKVTTSGSLGFRIAGMKVYQPDGKGKAEDGAEEHVEAEEDGYKSYDKYYGRGLTADNVHVAFEKFFGGEETLKKHGRTRSVAKRLAREVRNVAEVLEKTESRMYSASILMVYEGDEEAIEAALDEEKRRGAMRRANPGPENGEVKDGEEDEQDDDEVEGEDEDEDEDELRPKVSDMRLIDFAHAQWTPGQGPDINALQGVRAVLKILERLTDEHNI
jgi:inositol-polyphosphate multikinase